MHGVSSWFCLCYRCEGRLGASPSLFRASVSYLCTGAVTDTFSIASSHLFPRGKPFPLVSIKSHLSYELVGAMGLVQAPGPPKPLGF